MAINGGLASAKIPELEELHVHIKDRDTVTAMIKQIITDGKDRLQVIADFDNTLSCFERDGEKCVTCHKALDDSPRLPNEYRERAWAFRNHYYPMEIDPSLTVEEKCPLMVKWWTQSHDLLVEYGLSKHDIHQIIKEAKLYLRDGCNWLFDELHARDVPLLIFSAGLGDIIEEAVRQQTNMYPNMHIVANFMTFNNQGVITGWQSDLIHSFNKNENSVHDSDYFTSLEGRDNIILLGDSLGDLKMADGAKVKNLLKIGFLNTNIEERLESYKDAFDIVIISDPTMKVPNAIVRNILEHK